MALGLAGTGYAVVIVGRRLDALLATVRDGEALPGRVVAIPADVSNPDSVDALFREVASNFGRIDVLFNNAGISSPPVPFDELTFEQWQAALDVNVTGTFLCAQRAFRQMKLQSPRGGRIINNGSISAHVPRPHSAPYTATKHAITGLTKSLSLDGRVFDIACGQIDIGNAATDMTHEFAAGALQADGTRRAEPLIDLRHVVGAVLYMVGLPLDANVLFMTVMATRMPYVGRG